MAKDGTFKVKPNARGKKPGVFSFIIQFELLNVQGDAPRFVKDDKDLFSLDILQMTHHMFEDAEKDNVYMSFGRWPDILQVRVRQNPTPRQLQNLLNGRKWYKDYISSDWGKKQQWYRTYTRGEMGDGRWSDRDVVYKTLQSLDSEELDAFLAAYNNRRRDALKIMLWAKTYSRTAR